MQRTFVGIAFLTVLLVTSTPIVAQEINDAIVRVRSPDTETGTGIVIGVRGKRLYVLTAKHVVESFTDGKVYIFARQSPDLSFIAKVMNLDDHSEAGALDLAILEIDLDAAENFDNGLFLNPRIFLPTVVGRSQVQDCDIGEAVRAIGHASGTFNQHWIPTVIQSSLYDNETAFFTISSGSIEGGISGSPLLNSNNELIGIVVEVNSDGKTAKAVALSSILNFLVRHSVVRNLLVQAPIVGRWVLSTVKLPEQNYVKIAPELTLILSENGKASGLVNGRYCLKDKEQVQFRVSGIPASIAIPRGNGVETSCAIRDKEYCRLHVSQGYNFANSTTAPPSEKRMPMVSSKDEVVRGNQGMTLSLICQGTFGSVHYSFVKGTLIATTPLSGMSDDSDSIRFRNLLEKEGGFGELGGPGYAMAYTINQVSENGCDWVIEETNTINKRGVREKISRYSFSLSALDPAFKWMPSMGRYLVIFNAHKGRNLGFEGVNREVSASEKQMRSTTIGFHFEGENSSRNFAKVARAMIIRCQGK